MGSALLDSVDEEALRKLVLRRATEIERGEVVPGDAMDVCHRLVAKKRGD